MRKCQADALIVVREVVIRDLIGEAQAVDTASGRHVERFLESSRVSSNVHRSWLAVIVLESYTPSED